VLVILKATKLTCLADLINLKPLITLPRLVFKSTCGIVLGLLIGRKSVLVVVVNQLGMNRRSSGKHVALRMRNLVLDVVHLANGRQILLQFT